MKRFWRIPLILLVGLLTIINPAEAHSIHEATKRLMHVQGYEVLKINSTHTIQEWNNREVAYVYGKYETLPNEKNPTRGKFSLFLSRPLLLPLYTFEDILLYPNADEGIRTQFVDFNGDDLMDSLVENNDEGYSQSTIFLTMIRNGHFHLVKTYETTLGNIYPFTITGNALPVVIDPVDRHDDSLVPGPCVDDLAAMERNSFVIRLIEDDYLRISREFTAMQRSESLTIFDQALLRGYYLDNVRLLSFAKRQPVDISKENAHFFKNRVRLIQEVLQTRAGLINTSA